MSVRAKKGFTILELLIAVAVIGILFAVVVPAFTTLIEATRRRVCVANQRTLFEAAALYELGEMDSLEDEGSQKNRLDKLVETGYIDSNKGFECPSSSVQDYDDYIMIFVEGSITDIECQLRRNYHKWLFEI